MIKKLTLSGVLILCTILSRAISNDTLPTSQINGISTAVPFLRIDPEARAGAMGDAGIAISADANSIYWNTAKLAFADKPIGIGVTYTPWLRSLVNDVYLADLSGYYHPDDLQSVTASLRYFSLGSIQFTDDQGNIIGNGSPREFAVDGGYARKLSDNFSVGVNLKYVYSNLAAGQSVQGVEIKAGTSVAGDISAFYNTTVSVAQSGTLAAGATISNIGSKMSYSASAVKDYIPTNLGIGGALTMNFDDFNKLTLALDFNKLLVPEPVAIEFDSSQAWKNYSVPEAIIKSFTTPTGGISQLNLFSYSLGAEYWYNNLFALRGGYYGEYQFNGNRKYLTAGFGVKYNVFQLNFSYLIPTNSQQNPLANTLRFSLLFNFDTKKSS